MNTDIELDPEDIISTLHTDEYNNPFLLELEKQKSIQPLISYIELIVELCEKYNLDILDVAERLPPNLKLKIEAESAKVKLLKKSMFNNVKYTLEL